MSNELDKSQQIPISDERLNHLETIAQSATRGPWSAEAIGSEGYLVLPPVGEKRRIAAFTNRTFEEDGANALLVAESRTAIPELIGEIRRLRKLKTYSK